MNWNKYPFIRFLSALALGIMFHDVFGSAAMGFPWLYLLLLLGIGVLFLLFCTLNVSGSMDIWRGDDTRICLSWFF